MSKRCVLITSHLNTNEKINVALNTVNFLKEKNIPIIFVGNYQIPEEIQKNCDWVLFTKENPTVNRRMNYWYITPKIDKFGRQLKVNYIHNDYGYAHLLQIYRGFKLAKSLDYDYVIYINYDVVLTDEIWNTFEKITQDESNLVHGRYTYTKYRERIIINNEYETLLFCFKTNDLIHVLDKSLDFYKNSNPPEQPESWNWVCETFFKWMIDRSNINYEIIYNDLNKSLMNATSNNIFTLENHKFRVFIYEEENSIILISENNISDDFVLNTTSGKIFNFEKTNLPKVFIIPLEKESDYYYEDKFIFNYNKLRDFFVN